MTDAHDAPARAGGQARTIRKQLSKRTRFEVFKRDGFACIYCGAHPPAVILHVDHVVPVKEGGTNVLENLVTACAGCNGGKGAVPLSKRPKSLKAIYEAEKEREAQIVGYQEFCIQRIRRQGAAVDAVDAVFQEFNPGYQMNDFARRSVRRFLEKLSLEEVIEAIDIAYRAKRPSQWRYFCGVCWTKIRANEDQHG
mgnify:CR=1 FL=1